MVKPTGKSYHHLILPPGQFEAMVHLMGLLFLLNIVPHDYIDYPMRRNVGC
jgi:hypothetical protein